MTAKMNHTVIPQKAKRDVSEQLMTDFMQTVQCNMYLQPLLMGGKCQPKRYFWFFSPLLGDLSRQYA